MNKNMPLRTRIEHYKDNKTHVKEVMKKYQQNNKESIALYKKQYFEENKDAITNYKHDHYIKNKEHYQTKNKEWYEKNKANLHEKIICECGLEIGKVYKNRHIKTKQHIRKTTKLPSGSDHQSQ
jgi:hypothetical protein